MKYSDVGIHESFDRARVVRTSSDRTFGFIWSGFLLLVALAPLLRAGPPRPLFLLAGILTVIFALVRPQLLRPLNRLWTKFGFLLHRLVSPFFLALVFWGLFTPIGLLMRLTGKDPMRRQWEKESPTYWIPVAANESTMRDQF